jgi:serine/threonine-protein kinase
LIVRPGFAIISYKHSLSLGAHAMKLILSVTAGPHQGKEFTFEGHDTFLVGRVNDAHLQLSFDDPYFSRRQFVLEINPPRCRLMDLKSRNGTEVNGRRVEIADVKDGDVIKAGHTLFKVSLVDSDPSDQPTYDLNSPTHDLPQQPSKPASDPTLPGLEIVKELGRGGMGVVYQARRASDGTMLAVKTINPAAGCYGRRTDRFLREASIQGQLRHPNIVALYEVGRSSEMVYLTMELVNGPDLSNMLSRQGPMDIKTAVRAICQMLSGLQHAHDQGFVHRDIKPSNILIHAERTKKTAKLADFGLARAYQSSGMSGLTLQGDVGGTPNFMAPEQVTHFRDARPAADQYSAAATLYTAITGRHVHNMPAGGPQQLVHITTADPVPIRSRRDDVPEGLAAVIHKALSREPGDRYPDVAAFRGELKRWA